MASPADNPSPHALPAPPPGTHGWPWEHAAAPFPARMPDGRCWPTLSIVTPSFNQADYLEETIRSVLLQGYPNLEYFIIDGGSSDQSLQIIRKYESWLTGWVSEKDRGQSHAINKGFERSSGEWLGWLNSDDCYAPGALQQLVGAACPARADVVFGSTIIFAVDRLILPVPFRKHVSAAGFHPQVISLIDLVDQPSVLWRRSLYRQVGALREDMHYAFDWDFFIRCSQAARVLSVDRVVAMYRWHARQKSSPGQQARLEELHMIYRAHLPEPLRSRFDRLTPLVLFLEKCVRLRSGSDRAAGFLARVLLFAIRRSQLLKRLGLPMAIWNMLEVAPWESGMVTRVDAGLHAGSAAEALARFQEEGGAG